MNYELWIMNYEIWILNYELEFDSVSYWRNDAEERGLNGFGSGYFGVVVFKWDYVRIVVIVEVVNSKTPNSCVARTLFGVVYAYV